MTDTSQPFVYAPAPLQRYFEAFNSGQFQTAATLFSPQGELCPPFESAIVGPEQIADYLQREAKEMQALPQLWEPEQPEQPHTVRGTVQTTVFKVNVAWLFWLNAEGQIDRLQIRLLAALQELLNLRQ
ncbi:nuclear transport factor 2 family protein [Romeria aff. gracilis LEGE 07310]|uniref:Nuclear transport factor 2 family protein n=1 Tax=Vasconcelosia minhoensis LEGE 07310 TaxID=915328 RepID=A0A8J7DRP5_9CYAN|nr:nuclear transport factor 2 family protein [Romeria gracilis]MBE9079009.1 nuclear transport factor 2 family protein [Romeria aff. gracilis LEGE 07310]